MLYGEMQAGYKPTDLLALNALLLAASPCHVPRLFSHDALLLELRTWHLKVDDLP